MQATSMFLADVRDGMCWLQFWDVGDRFNVLKNSQDNKNSRQQYDFVTNILNLSQSKSHQNNIVTNTTIAIYKYLNSSTSQLNFFARN